ncbi:outer membrane protein [Paucilactobacillus oligofermentans DSM 15707 = LMG 22743]|uniref:Outer membrane protein n=1 Tax=Paucilactobacillus oligofermentans DSM 15707 = LMG 22743 TaxID=1423778 RepID=A0A0R1RJN7_9LACO|nr:right-handed parallel beta-helix repeat-containing protein [Paucilactobacillus oligofermentans]KRL55460.1 outer membrane protein [Paucilactobacillus oligofermentans DSM 15707 = LMG 22743]CUS25554.1 Putative xylosidase [Paucilactobacillus oligofermentans DSM 15707 = LMG 22743]
MKIYVNSNTFRSGDGTEKFPYKFINEAAQVALPGDEVLVLPGTYRENVNPVYSGTEDKKISYRSVEPLKATITGAEVINHWEKYQGDVWVTQINNSVFGKYNPYKTYVAGDWYFGPVNKHTGAVYMNDIQFYETTSLDDCIEGKEYARSWDRNNSIYKWYTKQNEEKNETIIYANFHEKNPNEESIDINVRREVFWPKETGINYITVSGFNLNKAATTWAPPAAYQDGLIGPHWSKGWIIEDCDISYSRCAGISLGKYKDPDNDHYFTYKHIKSPTQMERDAVCRGQYHGWLKETIGHHIVRRCDIHNCEQDGIVGRQGGVFSLIEDNHVHHINNMQELAGAEIAGIKIHAAIDVIIRRNRFDHNTMGLWCDWEAQGTRITQNIFDHNYAPDGTAPRLDGAMASQDIWVEVSHGPTTIDNNLLLSKSSLKIPTQGLAVVNNLILGAFTFIGTGTDCPGGGEPQPRYTPYHIPHRTEVAGFMTILHGDDRFYNNIFIQKWPAINPNPEDNEEVGTAVFNDYPTYEEWYEPFKYLEGEIAKEKDMESLKENHFAHLPIWASGNVYFNNAKAWEKESNNLINNKDKIEFELIDTNKQLSIKTNLYDFIDDFRDNVITTNDLGTAFEPEQRFEMPNGDDINFNEDYFGNLRGVSTIPGPFTSYKVTTNKLW